MRGDAVELRLPDGQVRRAAIRLFGIDGWQKDGYFYTASNPASPDPTLNPRRRARRYSSRHTGLAPGPGSRIQPPERPLLVLSDDPSYGRWPRLTMCSTVRSCPPSAVA
jgi:hypothetical protein